MRHLTRIAFLLFAFLPLGAWAQEGSPGPSNAGPHVALPSLVVVGGVTVPVQKVLHQRQLTSHEVAAIETFMADHPGLAGENVAATRNALKLLLVIGQSHLPLTRQPAAYLADYQTVTQLLKYLKLYVNLEVGRLATLCEEGPVLEAAPLDLTRASYTWVELGYLSVIKDSQGHACGAVVRAYGGAVVYGEPGKEVREVIGAIELEQECNRPKPKGTCGPGGPSTPPAPPDAAGGCTGGDGQGNAAKPDQGPAPNQTTGHGPGVVPNGTEPSRPVQ